MQYTQKMKNEKNDYYLTLISLTLTEISVLKPLSTCKERSNSSVMPIFACFQQIKLTSIMILHIQ